MITRGETPPARRADVTARAGAAMASLPHDRGARGCGVPRSGGTLVPHAGAAEAARDGQGRSFPLRRVLEQAPALTPARLVAGVHAAPARRTGGRFADGVAPPAPRDDRVRPTRPCPPVPA
ncbi:hypothetical protein [Streptomyces sp. NPDC001568]|uniref:hypothetical protein n=1 Tax=Streptomyces sp. NPDC001568 TaxID=3364588 RepID=UPI00368C7373